MSQPDASSSVPLPELNHHPTRSLRPVPLVFTVAGTEFEVPPLPAADWLGTLMQDWIPDDVILDLVPNGVAAVMAIDDPQDCENLVLALVEEASGRDWWVALRLIGAIAGGWHVLGPEMFLNHVDPQQLSLAGWLDAMSLILARAMDREHLAMFWSQVELPPVQIRAEVIEEMEMSMDQFMSIARG